MKSCREVVDLLSDYIAGDLSPEDVDGIRLHLNACTNCLNFLDSFKTTVKLTRSLRNENVPYEAVDRLWIFPRSRSQKR